MPSVAPVLMAVWEDSPRLVTRNNVARFELGCVAAIHAIIAFTVLLAPRAQVITPGTSVIFGTIPPLAWAVWFLATSFAAALATMYRTPLRLALTWCGAFPLGGAWTYGFSQAVLAGHGNAIFAVLYPFLLLWWLALAIRLQLGGTGDRWNGG